MIISTYTKPFNYFVIENFLPKAEYDRVKKSSLASVVWEENLDFHDQFGMITDKAVLKTLAGKEMRDLIFSQFGKRVIRSLNSIPQLRRTLGKTNGVPAHSDSDCGFDVAVFLHLTEWLPNMGGDLQILSKNTSDFSVFNSVQPKANTLVVLAFSEDSYHCVTPVTQDVERITLISEWKFA